MGEQRWRLGPTSIPSELGHLAVPIKFFAQKKKNTWPTRVSNPGPLGPELYPAFAPHWLDKILSRKSRLISRTKIDGTIEFDLCGIYCILILLVDWKLMLSSLHRTASRYSFLFWNLKIIISEFTDAFRTRHQHRFITHWRELRGKYSRMRFEKCSLLNRTVISEVVLALLSVAHRTLKCRKFKRKKSAMADNQLLQLFAISIFHHSHFFFTCFDAPPDIRFFCDLFINSTYQWRIVFQSMEIAEKLYQWTPRNTKSYCITWNITQLG